MRNGIPFPSVKTGPEKNSFGIHLSPVVVAHAVTPEFQEWREESQKLKASFCYRDPISKKKNLSQPTNQNQIQKKLLKKILYAQIIHFTLFCHTFKSVGLFFFVLKSVCVCLRAHTCMHTHAHTPQHTCGGCALVSSIHSRRTSSAPH